MNEITLANLLRIMPHIKIVRAGYFLPALNAAMADFHIDTPVRQAAFIAQIAHESGSFTYLREIADGSAYDNRADIGNTRPEAIEIARINDTTPGRFYRGRGLIQITGYDNYAACSEALFGDTATLTHNPFILERKEPACRSAAWYWFSRGLNAIADAGNFEKITRRINGGLAGYPDRLAFHNRALKELAA